MSSTIFIVPSNVSYSDHEVPTGLLNSCLFTAAELIAAGRQAEVQVSSDPTQLGQLTDSRFTHVFVEGLWVSPADLAQLRAARPAQQWVVRIHSEIPFLATEGQALSWLASYLTDGVTVACNSARAHEQLKFLARALGVDQSQVIYLPNCYPQNLQPIPDLDTSTNTVLNVGCFGALRPMKNHLQQVFVAQKFADYLGLPLRFHTNAQAGVASAVAQNVHDTVVALGATHVEHPWEDRSDFLVSLSECDLLLQVSMSETFNYVAADATYVGKPLLVSSEVGWSYPLYGDPNDVDDCVNKLKILWANKPFFIQGNRRGLLSFVRQSRDYWLGYLA